MSPGMPGSPDAAPVVEASVGDASAQLDVEVTEIEAQAGDGPSLDSSLEADAEVTDGPGLDSAMEAAVCDRHFPACPSPAPSYQQDIAPIVQLECLSCHYTGSDLTRTAYNAYQGIYSDRGSILGQLYACEMPPANYPLPITSDQRTTFMAWIECGAPNN